MVNAKNTPQPFLIGLLIIGGSLVVVAFYLGFVLLNKPTSPSIAAEATSVSVIATQVNVLQPTPTVFVTVTPTAMPLPSSCAMLKEQQPAAEDGLYTIYLRGRTAVTLYCHDMANIPTDYLSLPASADGGNFSLISYPEGAIITQYEKVRLNPSSLIIDPTDKTFAMLIESLAGYNAILGDQLATYPVTFSDFGVATGCNRNQADAPLGRANIDLTGTSFIIDPEITFASLGNEVQEASNVVSEDGKTVNLAINGRCGIIQPNSPIQLVYQQP